MTKPRYAVYICDPTPWERGHDEWKIPEFFPLMSSLDPDKHGPWVHYGISWDEHRHETRRAAINDAKSYNEYPNTEWIAMVERVEKWK